MKRMTPWLTLLFPLAALSQQQSQPAHQLRLSGKIRTRSANEIVAGVTISNRSLGIHNLSDLGGNYRINARPGDTLVLSSAGYHSDSIVVSSSMLAAETTLYLRENVVTLPSVKVTETAYQHDSAQRREEYAWLLNRNHPVKLWNEKRQGDAPGFSFSPIGYFSKDEVRKRQLKARLEKQERDYYIDSKFPRARIAILTGLKGDSLDTFMVRYRPSYAVCRAMTGEDMLLYINDKMVLFRKQPKIASSPSRYPHRSSAPKA
ncbi:MAG TPA: carboxypeptidase-like regulatory domain-containing protein [Puia sp.]|uniref:carboxypeptidase-like regulatory domain-containing protein n=1 Tax=Puia sp. TaxID=2045100 RepID=UPI002C4AB14E|nr:carboxypeptidase-like regulatory domain-containing protein [Puia sp.]HVU98409.1 carboxypeptidase-like regulatory domain-containing protein [Puia sp.]